MGWSLLLQGWAGLEAKAEEELAGFRYLLMGQKYVYTIRIYIYAYRALQGACVNHALAGCLLLTWFTLPNNGNRSMQLE